MEQITHANVIQLFEIFDEPKKMNLVREVRASTRTAGTCAIACPGSSACLSRTLRGMG